VINGISYWNSNNRAKAGSEEQKKERMRRAKCGGWLKALNGISYWNLNNRAKAGSEERKKSECEERWMVKGVKWCFFLEFKL
jgi:hypothetical protein